MTDLSIIVVSWNAKKYVQECLSSLTQQMLTASIEIILVDNASTDGTPQMVRECFPQVSLIQNTNNLGFAKANNIGILSAKGRYVCLINSDVNVPAGCLESLYGFMERHPQVGIVGPRMLTPSGSIGRSYMRFPTVWNCLCTALSLNRLSHRPMFGGLLMTDFDGERTSEVDVLNGWFLVVRRQALQEVGVLDESFFMYGEDIDWCHRFRDAGWPCVYFAETRALHYGGASSQSASTRFYIEMHKANLRYWRKYSGRAGMSAYWLTLIIHHVIRALGYSLIYITRQKEHLEVSSKIRRSTACLAWLVGVR